MKRTWSAKKFGFLVLGFSVCLLVTVQSYAETELYEKALASIVTIPMIQAFEDDPDCSVYKYTGFVLKVSDDISVIGMQMFKEFKEIEFKIGLKASCPKAQYNRSWLFIDGKQVSEYGNNVGGLIYFDWVPLHGSINQFRSKKLSFKVKCAEEKSWYTGEKITTNWLGMKLDRPKYVDGEWKSELIRQKESVFEIDPDYIRALLDKISSEEE